MLVNEHSFVNIIGMWSEFLFVRVSIWIACGLWFLGSISRILSRAQQIARLERVYRWTWFLAGIFTWIHVFASYGLVHNWSHSAVLKHTGDESYAVIGLRVPWGVYANFVFAGILSGYSGWMILKKGRESAGLDTFVYFFLAFIVFNALVIFKTGPIRWIGLLGFAIVICTHLRCHGAKKSQASSKESSASADFLG
ncbi:MAG: hypothetical protein MUC83_13765 [Pirellula sp.]|jgi:hypothetical protein|nr:hypothetical protein [Pirellula sp.]